MTSEIDTESIAGYARNRSDDKWGYVPLDDYADLVAQREVLADALRDAFRRLNRIAMMTNGTGMQDVYNEAYPGKVRKALEECGLLRAQYDPSMIPAAWLPGAEEEEG